MLFYIRLFEFAYYINSSELQFESNQEKKLNELDPVPIIELNLDNIYKSTMPFFTPIKSLLVLLS